jgi:hypothetical protein
MDLGIIIDGILDFTKLLLLLSIVCFIGYKLLSPVREKIAEKFSLSWIKSSVVLNFIVSFVLILFVYLYFIYVGASIAPVRSPDLEYDLFENIQLIFFGVGRIFLAAVIISLFALFFELIASLFMENKNVKENRKNKVKTSWSKQFLGVLVACAICLLIFLFLFDWFAFGMFLFIFYGSVNPLPVFFLL